MSLDWMQSCFELEAMEIDFKDCQRSIKYTQEKSAQVQFEQMDRIRKYEENHLTEIVKEESKRKDLRLLKQS